MLFYLNLDLKYVLIGFGNKNFCIFNTYKM